AASCTSNIIDDESLTERLPHALEQSAGNHIKLPAGSIRHYEGDWLRWIGLGQSPYGGWQGKCERDGTEFFHDPSRIGSGRPKGERITSFVPAVSGKPASILDDLRNARRRAIWSGYPPILSLNADIPARPPSASNRPSAAPQKHFAVRPS